MYSTCLFCNKPLGANEVLEDFPVGRRLAFDEEKGRLWVVCRKCERWNLSPLEERWEAIEACERLFRGTRMRVSGENIGMARHAEGLELVRIGRPMRPEFAAWRYGDQFGRRRKRAILYGTSAAVVVGGVLVGGAVAGILSGGLLAQSGNFVNLWLNGRTRLKLPAKDGTLIKLKQPSLTGAQILNDADGRWGIRVKRGKAEYVFGGEEAQRVAGRIMPKLNSAGARSQTVQDAVGQIELLGGPDAFLRGTMAKPPQSKGGFRARPKAVPTLGQIPTAHKLALEMALHEEQERRALEGELKALELAWQAAEEVAAISDDLLVSEETRARLERYRKTAD